MTIEKNALYNAGFKQIDGIAVYPPNERVQHKHEFKAYEVCRHCGQTEAALTGCHHCDEGPIGERCWWCLRIRTA